MGRFVRMGSLLLAVLLAISPLGARAAVAHPPDSAMPTPQQGAELPELVGLLNYDLYNIGRQFATGDTQAMKRAMTNWADIFNGVYAYDAHDNMAILTATSIDADGVNLAVPGDYVVTVTLALTAEYAGKFLVPETLSTLKIPIFVCDPTRFELRVLNISTYYNISYIAKLSPEPTVEYTQSDTPLTDEQLADATWQTCPQDMAYGGFGSAAVERSALTPGLHYYFRLESNGRLSNMLHIVDDPNSPSYDYIGSGLPPDTATPPDTGDKEKAEIVQIFNYGLLITGRQLAVGDTKGLDGIVSLTQTTLNQTLGYDAQGNSAYLALDTIDASGVDMNVPGDYVVTAKVKVHPDWEDDFTISDERRTVQVPIYVCDPARFELRLVSNDKTHFNFTYLTALAQEPTALWLKSDKLLTEEQLNSVQWQACLDESLVFAGSNVGAVVRKAMEPGAHYYFRLQSGKRLSNILHIVDDPDLPVYDYPGGDRDGGDADGSLPPVTTEPPDTGSDSDSTVNPPEPPTQPGVPSVPTVPSEPELPTGPTPDPIVPPATGLPNPPTNDRPAIAPITPAPKPEPEPAPFLEEYGDTYSRLSGKRLRMMVEDGGSAQFSKQGVTLTFTKKTVEGLHLADMGVFYITIDRIGDREFAFAVSADGVDIASLPGTMVMLPYDRQDSGATLSLCDRSGGVVATGSYDDSTKLATFSVESPGRFTIVEQAQADTATQPPSPVTPEPVTPEPATPDPFPWPVLPMAFGAIAVAAGVWTCNIVLKKRPKP